MGKWTTIAEAAIELLSKKGGGALPAADEAASVVPKLLRDNPGAKDPEFYGPGGWLGSKIREAAENRASAAPDTTKATLGGMEGVTGFFRENLRIRPDALRGIKGAMGEERFAGGAKLKNLEDSIAKEGYRDDSPVLIAVREDGTPFIVEGNNRVEEAIKTGRPHIKVQLQYLRGAEDVEGPLSPDNLPSVMALPTDEASRMARARDMGFETNNPLYHGTPDSRGIYESGFSTPKERYVDKDLGGPYFFTDMSRVARSYADDSRADDMQNATPEVIKAFVKNNNPLRIDARKAPFREIQLENVRANLNKTQLETLDEMMPDLASREVDLDTQTISTDGLVKIAKALGNDSILIRNVRDSYTGEGSPSDVLAVFDRRSIRSVDAQFDPAKAGSADILAGLGVVGAGAALSQQDGFDYGALRNVAEESNGQSSD